MWELRSPRPLIHRCRQYHPPIVSQPRFRCDALITSDATGSVEPKAEESTMTPEKRALWSGVWRDSVRNRAKEIHQ
jgi:hypothetical protein